MPLAVSLFLLDCCLQRDLCASGCHGIDYHEHHQQARPEAGPGRSQTVRSVGTEQGQADRQKDPFSCKTCGHLRNVEPFTAWHRGFKRSDKPKCRAPPAQRVAAADRKAARESELASFRHCRRVVVAQEGPPSAAARLRGGADSRRAREAALQAKCWVGGWGGHYRIIAFRLLSGPIIAFSGKGSGAQKSTCGDRRKSDWLLPLKPF